MNKFVLIPLTILVSLSAVGQKTVSEKKTNELVLNLDGETLNFETLRYSSDFKPNNEKSYWWYKSGKIHETEGGFDGKLLNGSYCVFYLNKALKEKGEFKKGLKHGVWKTWHPNGRLKEVTRWKKGLKHGVFESYDENGDLMVQSKYKKGRLHGKSKILVKGNTQVRLYKNGVELEKEEKGEKKIKKPKDKKKKENP